MTETLVYPRPLPKVHYPCSEGQPIAESDFQLTPLLYAMDALRGYYKDCQDVYVAGIMIFNFFFRIFKSEKGHSTIGVILAGIVAYITLYSAAFLKYQWSTERAELKKENLISLAESNDREKFSRAMKNFTKIQKIKTIPEPNLWPPYNIFIWWKPSDQPNMEPLHLWAKRFFLRVHHKHAVGQQPRSESIIDSQPSTTLPNLQPKPIPLPPVTPTESTPPDDSPSTISTVPSAPK